MMTTNSVPEASSSETTSKTTAESVPAPIAFKAKHPLSKFKKNPVLNAGGPVSPTDKMMSPCTAKIEEKRNMSSHLLKPKSLVSQFVAVKKESEEKLRSLSKDNTPTTTTSD